MFIYDYLLNNAKFQTESPPMNAKLIELFFEALVVLVPRGLGSLSPLGDRMVRKALRNTRREKEV